MTKPMRDDVPVSYLRECFDFSESGTLTWKVRRPDSHFKTKRGSSVWHRRYAGKPAGAADSRGAIHLTIRFGDSDIGTHAHRVLWALATGAWPTSHLDHKDGNPANNSLDNLRLASHAENMANSKIRKDNRTGIKGITEHKPGKWRAAICFQGKRRHLGVFDCPVAAGAAYAAAAASTFGAFARQ